MSKLLTYLPETITEKGITFKREYHSGEKAGMDYLVQCLKAQGIKYRTVFVLAKNLRGRLDLHGKPYQPTKWIFAERNILFSTQSL